MATQVITPLFAAPSGGSILGALLLIVSIAVAITFTITRVLVPGWRGSCERYPQLRDGFFPSDSHCLRAGTLLVSGTISAGIVSGLLLALKSPTWLIVGAVCWFGGLVLARFLAGPRTTGVLSGSVMGAIALFFYGWSLYHTPQPAVGGPAYDSFCAVVILLAVGFGLGYGLSAFSGGITRLIRWLWSYVAEPDPHEPPPAQNDVAKAR